MGRGTGWLTGPDDEEPKQVKTKGGLQGHSEQTLPCGCILKIWISGLNAVDDPKCKEHEGYRKYICGICGEEALGLGTMRIHKRSHAI